MQRIPTALGLFLLPVLGIGVSAALVPAPPPFEFERASLILEINATDGDAEIVLDLKSDVDLTRLELRGPLEGDRGGEGKKVLSVSSSRGLDLGLSQMLIETGEPTLEAVLEAYPAGTYELSGKTIEGQRFRVPIELTHALLAAPEILFPAEGDEDIPVFGLSIQWTADPAASAWLVELEREDDLTGKIVATLPAGTSTFAVPEGFLVPDVEYQVGVRAIGADGNVTVSELQFVTQ